MGHCSSLQATAAAENIEDARLMGSVRWTCKFTCMPQIGACCLDCHTDPPLPWLLVALQDAAEKLQRKKAMYVVVPNIKSRWPTKGVLLWQRKGLLRIRMLLQAGGSMLLLLGC